MAALADSVRHAPAGYAALFDAATLGAAELDRIYTFDLVVREVCEGLVEDAERLPAAADVPALEKVSSAVSEAEAAVRRRTEALREVK